MQDYPRNKKNMAILIITVAAIIGFIGLCGITAAGSVALGL